MISNFEHIGVLRFLRNTLWAYFNALVTMVSIHDIGTTGTYCYKNFPSALTATIFLILRDPIN